MEQEIWWPVAGFEGLYEVSNTGKVRGLSHCVSVQPSRCKNRKYSVKAKEKTVGLSKNGYLTVSLCKDNKSYTTYLHRILAEAFIPNPNRYNVVNHKNGVKTDCRLENLEWCTSGYNNKHAVDNRLRKPANAILTEKTALQIKEMKSQGLTIVKIAEILKLSEHTVGEFLRGNSYKYFKV